MTLNATQTRRLYEGYALGLLNHEIANYAGVSCKTVRRHQARYGLGVNSTPTQLHRRGEQLAAAQAAMLDVGIRLDGPEEELRLNGRRAHVRTAMQDAEGSWRFRLQKDRIPYYDMVLLVALYKDEGSDFYFLSGENLPNSLRIRRGGKFESIRNDWHMFNPTLPALRA